MPAYKNNPLKMNSGVSLVEILIVLTIIAIMAAMGGVSISPAITKRKALNCGTKITTTIQLVRSRAQSEGRRAVFQMTGNTKAQDIDGDGNKEYFIAFVDQDSNGVFNGGDTIITHGTTGDELCRNQISKDAGSTITTIKFDPLGFVLNGGINKNIYLRAANTAVRVELVSITGMLRTYINTDNCGGNGCSTTDNWKELE